MSDRRTLASDYLLGELDESDRCALEERLRHDSALRARVETLAPIVAHLRELPGSAWPEPPTSRRSRTRTRLPGRLAVATLALALVAATLGYALHARSPAPTSGTRIALLPAGPQAPGARAIATMSARRMILDVRGLAVLHRGRFYELWLMSDLRHLVALGSFGVSPSGSATVTVTLPADPRRFTYIDISLQTAREGPRHSRDSVLRGPIM